MNLFNNFQEMPVELPEVYISNLTSNFSNHTNNLTFLEIIHSRKDSYSISNTVGNFSFSMILRSQFLGHYSFRVLDFSYNISIYPVLFNIEGDIAAELGVRENSFTGEFIYECQDENEIIKLLSRIFSSQKFNNSVSGLMRLSAHYANRDKENGYGFAP
ncbi:hypothetical protein [Aeromonas jandaei]|uniref:hypothetical protein n=1 Tax=Aeromonas jandaei TaxID=650 RepID=UPI0012DF8663|nr:hypothetical protein [Aeromonas jandaei]